MSIVLGFDPAAGFGTLNAKALEAARKRLQENLDSFDKEIAYQISTEGERADLWTEIDVNADDLRTVLSSLPHVGVSEEALESVKHAIIISMQGYDYGREELDEDIGPVFRTTSQQIALIEERAEIAAKRVIAALSRQQGEAVPVGWRYRYNGALYVTASEEQARQGFDVTPLYASPIASPAGEPGIKALEWDREAPTQWVPETWKAQSLFGEYDIQREKDGTFSGFAPNSGTNIFGSLDEAKAAAQADYETRVRSALHPTPAPVSAPVVTPEMVAAAKDAYWHVVHHGEGYGDDCYEAAIEAAFEIAFARSPAVVEGK